jgi:sugar-specific transcriptional regulator TrmB
VLTTREGLEEMFKQMIKRTNRSLRFCIPRLAQIESLGLLPIISGFPRMLVVNIAGDIMATDEHLVSKLNPKGVSFTSYDKKDRWILNRDGEDVIIALEKPDGNIIGFYSNESRIVSMLNSSLMEPWIRGTKI